MISPLRPLAGGEEAKATAIIPIAMQPLSDVEVVDAVLIIEARQFSMKGVVWPEERHKPACCFVREPSAKLPNQSGFYEMGFLFGKAGGDCANDRKQPFCFDCANAGGLVGIRSVGQVSKSTGTLPLPVVELLKIPGIDVDVNVVAAVGHGET